MEKKPQIKFDSFTQFRPKGLAQRYPVCNGYGTVNWGKAECHACRGRGYILVPSGKEMEKGER